jgi:hypothetical protein
MISSGPEAGPAAVEQSFTDHRGPGPSRQLIAVAALFVIGGLIATLNSESSGVLALFGGASRQFHVNLGILGVPIGIGLFRYRSGWRTAALVMTAISAAAALGTVLLSLTGRARVTVRMPGTEPWATSDAWIGVLVGGFMAAVALWIIHVLRRPDIRRRFQDRGADRAWLEWVALAAVVAVAYAV